MSLIFRRLITSIIFLITLFLLFQPTKASILPIPIVAAKSKETVNILLVGTDSRGEKYARSDSIMIATYNRHTHAVHIASIMRDSYVYIPTYKHKYNKINTAFFLGGQQLLRKTIEENFDVPIDYYVTIDFKGFINIIDMLVPEGIEVDVPKLMIDDMHLNLSPGIQKLHGKELLSYARFRHDKESDFGRVRRQQEIIKTLKDEVTKQFTSVDGLIQITKVTYEVWNQMDTDMPVTKMLSLGSDFLFNGIQHLQTIRIPIQDSYTDKTFDYAGRVLEVDVEKNRQALKSFLEGGDEPIKVKQEKKN